MVRVDEKSVPLKDEKEIARRVGNHPKALKILGNMIRDQHSKSRQDVPEISSDVLRKLEDGGVLMNDEGKEGVEWVRDWLKSLELEKHFELLVEVGEYDTKEKILKINDLPTI